MYIVVKNIVVVEWSKATTISVVLPHHGVHSHKLPAMVIVDGLNSKYGDTHGDEEYSNFCKMYQVTPFDYVSISHISRSEK